MTQEEFSEYEPSEDEKETESEPTSNCNNIRTRRSCTLNIDSSTDKLESTHSDDEDKKKVHELHATDVHVLSSTRTTKMLITSLHFYVFLRNE